jgi:transcriptional regulator with XRE-family HTH domain
VKRCSICVVDHRSSAVVLTTVSESRDVGETIGYQLRRLRRLRGLTQEELADRANVSRDLVAKLEQGRRHTARITSLASLAGALDVELSALVEHATPLLETEDGDAAGLVALRNALTCLPAASDEDPTPAFVLRRGLDEAWRDYWAGRYGRLVARLPGLIGEARQTANAALLAGFYQVASCVLCQVGKDVLGYVAADRGIQAAEQGDDELLHATLHGTLGWIFLHQGRYPEAEQVAVKAADAIEPRMGSASPSHLSVWGSLLLSALPAAAARGDGDTAEDLLSMAGAAATRLGAERNDYQTGFGPAKVAAESVHCAVALGETGRALELAPQVPRQRLATAAHGRHLLDVAQAQADHRRDRDAVDTLLAAERLSQEWLRHQALARHLVYELQKRDVSKLDGLAQRMGLTSN